MRHRATAVLLVTLLGAAVSLDAQPLAPAGGGMTGEATQATLTTALEPGEASIGDRVTATLTLVSLVELTAPPRFPVWQEHWGDAEILSAAEPVDLGRGVWTQQLTVAIFETGLATLPAPTIELATNDGTITVTGDPTILDILSVLPEGEEEVSPQPPAPVRTMPAGTRFLWVVAVLVLGCLVLGFFLLRTARRVQQALAAMALSPIDALGEAIAKLRRERDAERLFTGLSLELRRYLGRAVGFPAVEGTTTEIRRRLRDRDVPADLVRGTLELLSEADQIKFARGAVDPARATRRLEDAGTLAQEVEVWLRPAIEETEAEATT